MATPVPNPLIIKNASVKIGTVEYAELISNVTVTPTTPTIEFKGVAGKTFQTTGTESWVLQFDYAQDWTSAGSLALALFNGAGTSATVVITPNGSTGPKITVEATLQAGAFGGAVDTVAVASASLPVTGRPVFAAGV